MRRDSRPNTHTQIHRHAAVHGQCLYECTYLAFSFKSAKLSLSAAVEEGARTETEQCHCEPQHKCSHRCSSEATHPSWCACWCVCVCCMCISSFSFGRCACECTWGNVDRVQGTGPGPRTGPGTQVLVLILLGVWVWVRLPQKSTDCVRVCVCDWLAGNVERRVIMKIFKMSSPPASVFESWARVIKNFVVSPVARL